MIKNSELIKTKKQQLKSLTDIKNSISKIESLSKQLKESIENDKDLNSIENIDIY